MILRKPEAGWSSLTLKNDKGEMKSFRVSYVDDVPLMLMEQLTVSLMESVDTMIEFEAEGWEHRWIITDSFIYVIEDKDEVSVSRFWINKEDFARQIWTDLSLYAKEWACWSYETESLSDEGRELQVKHFRDSLNDFEKVIETYLKEKAVH